MAAVPPLVVAPADAAEPIGCGRGGFRDDQGAHRGAPSDPETRQRGPERGGGSRTATRRGRIPHGARGPDPRVYGLIHAVQERGYAGPRRGSASGLRTPPDEQ